MEKKLNEERAPSISGVEIKLEYMASSWGEGRQQGIWAAQQSKLSVGLESLRNNKKWGKKEGEDRRRDADSEGALPSSRT